MKEGEKPPEKKEVDHPNHVELSRRDHLHLRRRRRSPLQTVFEVHPLGMESVLELWRLCPQVGTWIAIRASPQHYVL